MVRMNMSQMGNANESSIININSSVSVSSAMWFRSPKESSIPARACGSSVRSAHDRAHHAPPFASCACSGSGGESSPTRVGGVALSLRYSAPRRQRCESLRPAVVGTREYSKMHRPLFPAHVTTDQRVALAEFWKK